ncbi:MAG: hypothetical protein ACI9KD_003333, partial [Congregibacter sp.]
AELSQRLATGERGGSGQCQGTGWTPLKNFNGAGVIASGGSVV